MTGPLDREPDEWDDPLDPGDPFGASDAPDAGVNGLLGNVGRGPGSRRAAPDRTRPRAVLAFLLVGVIVLVALVVVGVSAVGRQFSSGSDDFAGGGDGTKVQVQVMSGDSTSTIGQTLAADGVVKSAGAFRDAASANPQSISIQPGYYELQGHMSGASALTLMLDPASLLKSKVTIPEGTSLDRTVALIAGKTTVTRADLLAALAQPATLGLVPEAKNHPEGFLFPATYDVPPGTTATEALTMLAARFGVAADNVDLVAGAKALGMTPYDVVVVASLIEREAAVPSDRPMVASVIYNRLKLGMSLGLESAERYALGNYTGVITATLLAKAETLPYDTYKRVGLPPGPIDNPGEAALTAALHPSKDDNLYFVTLPKENVTKFVRTNAEFLALNAKCQAEGGC